MSHIDPHSEYPEFYANPIIGAIADAPRWTVSDNEKVPINMVELMSTGRIWGAHEISAQCLVDLPTLTTFLPSASNAAYYLRAQTDGFLVLDIEKTCPPDVAQQLLTMPAHYTEYSMSGKGYHLILPMPANFWEFPIAMGKKVLKEEHGWYEILLDHWVTFTRAPVPAEALPAKDYVSTAWEDLYASLAKDAVETATADFDFTSERPVIPRADDILELMTRLGLERSLDDFHGDHSRFEYSTLGTLYNRLSRILIAITDGVPDHPYDESVKAWLVYEAATMILPARDKHDEQRNGMPLLLNAAVSLVARRVGDAATETTA